MRPDDPSPARPSTADVHPDRIGGYRVLSVLGEGGMGVVYLAEQTEPVRREVALKILKLGMDTRQVVARFEAERQALAVMEHPGIAKVYDAGATDAGRPYFVMERVAGVPITEYADTHRLGVRDRVRLLAQVCRAVQHAHQKGVIHRDLKPSNVLITEADNAPHCKIIDFGIARAVEQTADDRTRLTQVEQSLGTPAYMSPEQVDSAGRDIDTRSDIYSLGVLLYELLAGVLPFEPRAYRGWALFAQHMVGEPPAPGLRYASLDAAAQTQIATLRDTEPASLRRQLRGELDWVVMRALEKDRDRRYETANGLTRDLERFLANEPVAASPPSRAYRARKFVRRHRAGVAFAAVVAVLLIGFAGAMGVQAERVARARDLAVVRQGQAEDLIGFMLGDLRGKLTPVGRLDILDEVGQRALDYFAAVRESELTAEELFRRSQALTQLGEVRLDQGNLTAAQQAFGDALTLAQGLSARDPENGEWQIGLGAAHFWVGYVHWLQGALEDALRQFNPYLDISRRMVQRDADNPQYQLELSYAWSNIGSVREAQGDLDGAVAAFRETLAVKRALVEQDSTNLEWQSSLANTLNTLGVALRKLGMLAAAEEQHRAEIEIKERLVRQDTLNITWQRWLGLGHHYLGRVLEAQGRDEALVHFAYHRDVIRRLHRRDPDNAEWRRELAAALRFHAAHLVAGGRAAEAMTGLRESRMLSAALLATDSTVVEWQREHAQVQFVTAHALLALGRLDGAEVEARAALEQADRVIATSDAQRDALNGAAAELWFGRVLAARGDGAGARNAWTSVLRRLQQSQAETPDIEADALRASALLLLELRDEAAAAVAELVARGYRPAQLVALAREKGAVP
jgi:eukaryotic-like serine/threonine-protein kinase